MIGIDFAGKVAVVTGAGGGIGRAVSLALARAGAKLSVIDLKPEPGEETVRLIRQQGGEARFICADVSSSDGVENYVRETVAAYGRIDVLMNNAGWEGVIKPITEYPDDVFDKVFAINTRGVFLGLKHVLRIMIAQKSGAIVNTSSGAGLTGTPNMVAYCASKHAVLGLTKTAALEVASHGIRVNAVCPGPVATPMMVSIEEGLSPGAPHLWRKQRFERIPDGRYAEPEEVANLMLYLASDMASHITGQSVVIDGGLR